MRAGVSLHNIPPSLKQSRLSRPAVTDFVELAPASSPRSAATPGGTAPIASGHRNANAACPRPKKTAGGTSFPPQCEQEFAFLRRIHPPSPLAPGGYPKKCRALARFPRSEATPAKRQTLFCPQLTYVCFLKYPRSRAPRSSKHSCVSTFTEERQRPQRRAKLSVPPVLHTGLTHLEKSAVRDARY